MRVQIAVLSLVGRGEAARLWGAGRGAPPVPAQVLRPLRAAVQWPLGCRHTRKGSESVGSCFTVTLPVDVALFSALHLSYQNEVKQNRKS